MNSKELQREPLYYDSEGMSFLFVNIIMNLKLVRPENLKKDKQYLVKHENRWFVSCIHDIGMSPYFDDVKEKTTLASFEAKEIYELPMVKKIVSVFGEPWIHTDISGTSGVASYEEFQTNATEEQKILWKDWDFN